MALIRRAAVVVPICACVLFVRFMSTEYLENDHFTYLAFAYQTTLGDLPDADYDDPGFPLGIALSALAMKLGGTSLLPEVMLTSSMLAIAACLTWRAGLMASGMPAMALFVTLLQVLVYPRLYAYPKIVMTAWGALAFFAYNRRPTRASLIGLALFTELSLLLRHDLAVYIFASALGLLLACHGRGRAGMMRLAEYAAWCAAFSVPYLVYLLVFGFGAHLDSSVAFSTAEARRTTHWDSLLTAGSWLTVTLVLLPLVAWAWLLERRRKSGRWDPEAPAVAATALLLAIVNAALLRDTTPSRLADVFGAAPVVIAWVGAQAIRWCAAVRPRMLQLLTAAVLVVLFGALTAATLQQGTFRSRFAETRIARGWEAMRSQAERQWVDYQTWPLDERAQGAWLGPLVRYLDRCTRDDDPVLIAGYSPQLGFLARRPFAGGHPWIMSGYFETPAEQRRMAQRLRARPPRVVVIDPREATDIPRHWPAIADMLEAYRPAQLLGGLEIRTAPSLPEDGVDAETGLPCFRK
ncbi:MAG: hypothetical protein ABL971_10515 [Vicinamibacterales bacterium]